MIEGLRCADLHVHSLHSAAIRREWLFRHLRVAECYTPPAQVYALARARGMDYVTITDHDTIDGVLEIAHLDGVFTGVELTTGFPDEEGTVHVVALGFTEAQYRDLTSCQEDVRDLVSYLNASRIPHFLAHPFYAAAGLAPAALERLLLLFRNVEVLNGDGSAHQQSLLARVLDGLTPQTISLWADRHGLEPVGPRPWQKGRVGGSDDHSGLEVARAYTACDSVGTPQAFLDAIDGGACRPEGEPGTAMSMAAAVFAMAYRHYQERGEQPGNAISTFLGSLAKVGFHGPRLPSWLRPGCRRQTAGSGLAESLRHLVPWARARHAELTVASLSIDGQREASHRSFYEGVNDVLNQVVGDGCRNLVTHLRSLDLEGTFSALGRVASAHFLLTAYYGAYRYHMGDRAHLQSLANHFGIADSLSRPRKVVVFSDVAYEVNGVALSLARMRQMAGVCGFPLTVLTSSDRAASEEDGLVNLPALAGLPLPDYPELSLWVPPVLEMLEYCHRVEATVVQVSTPGPVGLAGLLVARLLDLPVVGFYHTNIPDLVRDVTGDPAMSSWARVYTSWLYRSMDRVFVASERSRHDLAALGVETARLRLAPRGVDLTSFSPQWRDPSVWRRFGVDGELKVLYVGRMSKEKSLDVLAGSFRQLLTRMNRVHLVMVGDGPNRGLLQGVLDGHPVSFTGTLEGELLSRVYASSDIFVFPSAVDTFANVVLEAQASGLPVVVADRGGAQENIVPEVTGLATAPKVDDFARQMQVLLQDSARRSRMARAARAYAETRGQLEAFRHLWDLYP